MRTKLALAGIPEPLTQFPTIHGLLDVIEQLAVEGKGRESREAVERFYFDLYRPEPETLRKEIESADTDADFDAFAALGMH